MEQENVENWIGIEEVTAHLGVTKETVRNFLRKTNIPAHQSKKMEIQNH